MKTATQFWDAQKFRFCPQCQRKAFDFAQAYGDYRAEASSRVAEGPEDRCGNCDHKTCLHNIHGCTERIQLGEDNGKTTVDCPCGWDNLQASSEVER